MSREFLLPTPWVLRVFLTALLCCALFGASSCASNASKVPSVAVSETSREPSPPEVPATELPATGPEAPSPGDEEFLSESASRDYSVAEAAPGSPFRKSGPRASLAEPAPRARAGASSPRGPRPTSSGLQAGFSDDNQQFGWFADFLDKYGPSVSLKRALPISSRILITLNDEDGRPIPNQAYIIRDPSGVPSLEGRTYADGVLPFYLPQAPAGQGLTEGGWTLEFPQPLSGPQDRTSLSFDPSGPRSLSFIVGGKRSIPSPVPLDLVFILDTTGSMGEEIERLKTTIEIIKDNLDLANPRPLLRFGLVLYKDRGDAYVTKAFPLTADLPLFQEHLSLAEASGGGDGPEDLEAALAAALDQGMDWSTAGARLAFVITDAPAKLYADGVPYSTSAEAAALKAIRIHTIGSGGLPLDGEYQLRQIAQRTMGRYIFLSYGERGESEGGAVGSVSHHTGSNWTADSLESVVIRFAKEELALFGAAGTSETDNDWFEARPSPDAQRDAVLGELFDKTIARVLDYSTFPLSSETTVAIAPVSPSPAREDLMVQREFFGARLMEAASRSKRFRLVEREDLQSVLWELEFSLSSGNAESIGGILGAQLIFLPTLSVLPETATQGSPAPDAPGWELRLRLVRVATGEILSVSRARIPASLGL